MKKVNENLELLEELFEAWAEEVNESILGVFASLSNEYTGHAVIEAESLYYADIRKLEKALRDNGFKIDQIESAPAECIGIWFGSIYDED